jgi:CRP-like cAMP-binding protein
MKALITLVGGEVAMEHNVKNVFLKLHDEYYPFNRLSEQRARESAEQMRFFSLKQGERLLLVTGNTSEALYVIDGSVAVSAEGDEGKVFLTPDDTRSKPFLLTSVAERPWIEAQEDSLAGVVDMETVEYFMYWDGLVNSVDSSDERTRNLMDRMRYSLAFRRIPAENVEKAFHKMREIQVRMGDEIFRQGDPGDTFYIVASGRAEVWRRELSESALRKIAEIGEGRTFGEEALVTGEARNATIRIAKDGVLLALDKKDFQELYSESIVKRVSAEEAKGMLDGGRKLIDVRYLEEFAESRIPGSLSYPLKNLRMTLLGLDPTRKYIVVCADGKRSALAALLLNQRGFDAVALNDGLKHWPYGLES